MGVRRGEAEEPYIRFRRTHVRAMRARIACGALRYGSPITMRGHRHCVARLSASGPAPLLAATSPLLISLLVSPTARRRDNVDALVAAQAVRGGACGWGLHARAAAHLLVVVVPDHLCSRINVLAAPRLVVR